MFPFRSRLFSLTVPLWSHICRWCQIGKSSLSGGGVWLGLETEPWASLDPSIRASGTSVGLLASILLSTPAPLTGDHGMITGNKPYETLIQSSRGHPRSAAVFHTWGHVKPLPCGLLLNLTWLNRWPVCCQTISCMSVPHALCAI